MITDREMEKLIEELYLEEMEEMETSVDMEAALNQAYREIEQKKAAEKRQAVRRRRKSVLRAAMIFLVVLVAALVAFEPEAGYADVFRRMFDSNEETQAIDSDNFIGEEADVAEKYELDTYEELNTAAGYDVPVPAYLPEGYALERIILKTAYGKTITATIQYCKKETRQAFYYHIYCVEDKKAFSSIMDIPEEQEEPLKINDDEGSYYRDRENEKNAIYWQGEEFFYGVDGGLAKEELLKIAESVR